MHTYQQLPPSPPHQQHELHADEFLRSQSADPNTHCNRIGKVREFKPIKRLPKPLLSSNFSPVPITQSHLSSVTSVYPPLSPIRTASGASSKHSTSNGANSTPLAFSLSQFPQPPNSVGPPLSPLTDGNERSQVKTASFVSTAPVTPPATPAVVHYRGASFDLVNPHSSLVLDNIVTPSRELDSSDCLPLLSSDDLLVSPEVCTLYHYLANTDNIRWPRSDPFTVICRQRTRPSSGVLMSTRRNCMTACHFLQRPLHKVHNLLRLTHHSKVRSGTQLTESHLTPRASP